MPDIFILTEPELRKCVVLDKQTIDMMEDAFKQLAGGDVIMPPALNMDIPMANGEVDVRNFEIKDDQKRSFWPTQKAIVQGQSCKQERPAFVALFLLQELPGALSCDHGTVPTHVRPSIRY